MLMNLIKENEISLTKATIADLDELTRFGRQTFYESFAWGNTDENMQQYLDANFTQEKLLQEFNNPETVFYVVKYADLLIGYVKINFGDAQTDLKDKKGLELERIYVSKEYQGRQVGQMLVDKTIQSAEDNHLDYVWLGVWEENHKAIKFYERNGFKQFDTHIFKLGDDEQTDKLMRLDLNSSVGNSKTNDTVKTTKS